MTASFPSIPGLDAAFTRAMMIKSDRQEAISGARTQLPRWPFPRWTWTLKANFLRDLGWDGVSVEFQTLATFILSSLTQGTCFGYTDRDDNAATNQRFGTGDGTTTAFQLVRSLGGFVEPVLLPTITSIAVAGSTVSPTIYSLGGKGVVTFTSAPASSAALTWTGSYQWLCRFDEDSVDFDHMFKSVYSLKSLKFSSEINP
ncbi:MAG: DUF2460 domain-containing protein [Ancalomicrobiaceae bacterium]|nr:DUF2460 domain-containing protein [Ancalomicrobiaceae bacterium]